MEKDDNLSVASDKLIDECSELTELQSKWILLIQEHLKQQEKEFDSKTVEGVEADEEKITRDTEDLCKKLLKDVDEELDVKIERIMKNFAAYEVYKAMK